MKHLWLPVLILLTPAGALSESRVFTDLQGRKITAEIIEYGAGWVKVKRKDGHKFDLSLDKLSEEDRQWIAAQLEKKNKETAAKKRAVEVPAKILAYCKSQVGKQVGNGECWTLADEAFKACGLHRPGSDMRVWGRKLDFPKEAPQPGDIVEFRTAAFSDGGRTGPAHTAVVVGTGKKGVIVIAEQNWGGNKTVRERPMDPAGLKSGDMWFYRPE